MAQRLPDGSIKMSDGRIIYGDTLLQAQDFIELLPIFSPPAWPFVSGGGGAAGEEGSGFVATGALGRGLQGFQGTNPGVQGPQGNLGPQGRQGSQGSAGPQGVTGVQGNQGRQGAQGLIGPQGNQGLTGPQGLQGLQGNQGNQGILGSQGPQGVQGNQGIQGLQGTNPGVQGPQGFQGISGAQGFQGDMGFQGTTSNAVNLQFGSNNSVGAGGSLQLEGPGTALVGITLVRAGTITGASVTVNSPSTNNYNLNIRVNGVTNANVPLAAGSTQVFDPGLAVPVVAGDTITVFLTRVGGSGGSGFNNEQALIEISS